MTNADVTATILVDQSAKEAFDAIETGRVQTYAAE